MGIMANLDTVLGFSVCQHVKCVEEQPTGGLGASVTSRSRHRVVQDGAQAVGFPLDALEVCRVGI